MLFSVLFSENSRSREISRNSGAGDSSVLNTLVGTQHHNVAHNIELWYTTLYVVHNNSKCIFLPGSKCSEAAEYDTCGWHWWGYENYLQVEGTDTADGEY